MPYIDKGSIRTFSKDVDPMELIWHTDKEDRIVEILEGEGWQFQRDDELPFDMLKGDRILIPEGQIHRVIKGKTDLIINIQTDS